MPNELLAQLNDQYPYGYNEHLLRFTNSKGESISALPFETDDIYYLVKIEKHGHYHLIEDDDIADDDDELAGAEELDLDDSEE